MCGWVDSEGGWVDGEGVRVWVHGWMGRSMCSSLALHSITVGR